MSELFPRAPLVATVFQLRFGGEIAVEQARPLIQDAVRKELPLLFVPKATPGVAPALQGYSFKAEDDREGVDVALNSFTYVTTQYPGFESFKDQSLRFLNIFLELVPVHRPNRLGLRYVNQIPILRGSPKALIPVEDYLTIDFLLPSMVANRGYTDLDVRLRIPTDHGSMRIHVDHATEDRDKEVLRLDFDYSESDGIVLADVKSFLDRAHDMTKRLFMDIVSPQYLELIRKEQ